MFKNKYVTAFSYLILLADTLKKEDAILWDDYVEYLRT